jgi:glycoprotein endo-alpha-1,2-mannosidase
MYTVFMRISKTLLTPILILMLVILACTSTGQTQIQTQVSLAGKTALAQGGEIAKTQAAKLEKTAVSIAETQTDKLKETAVAAAATKADDIQETAVAALETQLAGGNYPRQFPNTARNDNLLVGAYYYPWYGPDRIHWQDGYAEHPTLGEYDSADRKVINQHIDWAAGHGIDFFAVSWWGIGSHEDQVFKDELLNSPMRDEIQFAVLYESAGLLPVSNETIDLDSPDTLQKLLDDFKYIQDTYFNDPHYLKIGDRPVVFIYLTRIFTGDVGGAFSALRGALRSRGSDVYLVGDEVYWGNAQSLESSHIQAFDAVTAYNMHTSVPDIADNFSQKVQAEFTTWKATAGSLGVAFVPDALPGFDDTLVRPEANHPPIPRSVDLFENQLDIALSLLDPQIKMFTITSWNEWHEDTSIEPAQEFGLEYLDALQRKLDSRTP